MANGQKIQFKKRKTVTEILPDAPEDEWKVLVPKGLSVVGQTAPDKGADPFILWSFKLEEPGDEKNESFKGTLLTNRSTFYDANDTNRRKVANMQLRWMRGLIEAAGLDFDEVYPTELEDEGQLKELVDKIEGKRFTIWTKHRTSVYNGEAMLNVDIRFAAPGGQLAAKDEDEDDEDDDKPAKKKPVAKRR
jgi:hypothetical protein